jgi:hypothetical protein
MLALVRRPILVFFATAATAALAAATFLACARSDPPPGTPAQAAPCPDDAGTELPRELACCLIQARTSEEAQICLARADAGH